LVLFLCVRLLLRATVGALHVRRFRPPAAKTAGVARKAGAPGQQQPQQTDSSEDAARQLALDASTKDDPDGSAALQAYLDGVTWPYTAAILLFAFSHVPVVRMAMVSRRWFARVVARTAASAAAAVPTPSACRPPPCCAWLPLPPL
jgi:hypothetical protein